MKICVKTNRHNIIIGYAKIINNIKPFEDGFEVDANLETIDLVNNYKYVGNKVVELTDEEKEILYPPVEPQPTKEELLQKQLLETQNMILELQYKLTNKDLVKYL